MERTVKRARKGVRRVQGRQLDGWDCSASVFCVTGVYSEVLVSPLVDLYMAFGGRGCRISGEAIFVAFSLG